VNGELEHAIAVAARGSAWLRDGGAPPALEDFAFVREVRFVDPDGRERPPAEWFEARRRDGAERIWLILERRPPASDLAAPHQLAGFVGAGNWVLLAGTGVWRGQWRVGWPDAPDRRIWAVGYRGIEIEPLAPARPDLAETERSLRSILTDARDFCLVNDEDMWAGVFANALAADGSSRPLPGAFGPDAQRLMEMASRAWVFGGMGSFNDLGFDTDEANRAYDLVSSHLYGNVLAACVAATNAPLTP
jgi:hypothetical protein